MLKKDKMKFKYIFDDDYNPKYANGAYGGLTPRGEIVVNFFFERTALPKSQTHEITEKGILGDEIDSDPKDLKRSIIRYVDTGIIVNPETAKIIIDWLQKKVETLEKLKKDNIITKDE